jgi:UDP-N-acetylglucosamine 2-epimerase (non-hydrolysing)
MDRARLVLTDSGGIQEETTILGVDCVTLRDNTERPVTLTHGTNRLAGTRAESIREAIAKALHDDAPPPQVPPLWDGHAAERIAAVLAAWWSAR